MQAVVDKLLATYHDEGKGKVVLLLHGWGDASGGLANLRKELAKTYRVITPDLPGFGASDTPKSAWSLDDYAGFCQDLLAKLDIKSLAAVIGHSNGGAIAIRGVSSGQLRASKLVLLASAGIRGEYRKRNLALRYAAKSGKQFSKLLPKSSQQKLRAKVYKTIGSDMLVAENLQETFRKIINDDVRADAARISQPTLLVYGERDEQTPPRYGETFHELIKNSRLEIVSGAGHFVHLDASTKVAGLVKGFLK